ncbi:hypothetical protein [Clostridium botulinum]|uniref:Uncharacterized protein n=1 Tax=Clostridium botulinum TaxID=1491 RepID=A0A6G4EET1_CLOBO|nr:hypothetical protein [Clostridium botulinum]APH18775.1 hypothetical protein NPD3_457 [Clostridium botulinum]AUM91294.1 hypothetical protein RSJ5_08395 [Clostridium botulinum]NFB13865.1 hypothetical protein [Clostridium botulinum]NFH58144.1 hypothetical protein [Clostridium botulinum]NFH61736.1 hypothetical protein [Clostridium botulinum]
MKMKKIMKTLIISGLIIGSVSANVLAGTKSDIWSTPCHSFKGVLNTFRGKRADASTTIRGGKEVANAYVYVEGVDQNGYRVGPGVENYGRPVASRSIYAYRATHFNSRHTVKDRGCKNYYFQLRAE